MAALCNIYLDDAIETWLNVLNYNFRVNTSNLNCLLFADDQVVISDSENHLQSAAHKLFQITKHYNLTISNSKTKAMAFNVKQHKRSKIVID